MVTYFNEQMFSALIYLLVSFLVQFFKQEVFLQTLKAAVSEMLDQQRHQINRSRKWQRFVNVKHRKLFPTQVEFRPKYIRK